MPKETLETLISELNHEEDWRRMRSTVACLKGGPQAVTGLIQAMVEATPEYKSEAIKMLARIRDHHAGIPLVKMISDENEAVSKSAIDALEQMAGILDEPTAAELVEMLKDEGHRERITHLIGAIPPSIGPLTKMLKDPDESARVTAATILDHLLDPRSADALVDAMGDPAIQGLAADTLRRLGAIRDHINQVMNELANVEESELREGARQEAVIKLHPIGRPAVEILIEYLEDDDWVVREAAADVLGKIADIRAVEPLMERLRVDQDTGVKELATKSLGLLGDARPVDLLIESIPIRVLRVLAVEALEKIKDVEVLRPHVELLIKLKADRDGLVSYNSGIILDKLEAIDAQLDENAWAGKE